VSNCTRPDLGQQLYRWVRGEVEDASRAAEIAVHLDTCARCGAAAQELRSILGTMRLPGGPEYEAELARGMDSILHPGSRSSVPARGETPNRSGWWARLRRLLPRRKTE